MIIKNFLLGLIIGIGFIIPGVSGGVLATILGIYDEIIFRLNSLFKNFKSNIIFLIPIFTGIALSIIVFSKFILFLLNYKLIFISYVFIGLILGCIPFLIQEIKIKSQKNIALIPFLIAFILGNSLFLIETTIITYSTTPNSFIMSIAGLFYAIGKIVPGISGAALLMFLGIYEFFLRVIANPLSISFAIIISFIPFIITFLLSSIFIIKIISYLLNKHFRITYSIIIGFVLSSVLFIYPGYFSFINLITLILSFVISYNLSKK